MIDADRERFLKVINALAAIKPGAKLTPEGLDMWWLALRDWSIEEFEHGAAHLATSVEFMPSPFHFAQLRKAGRKTSGEAFTIAREVMRGASRNERNTSGDPIIDAAAAACGGYFAMGMTETEKLGFLERRFAEHYESISDAETVREAVPQLAGPSLAQPDKRRGMQRLSDLLESNT